MNWLNERNYHRKPYVSGRQTSDSHLFFSIKMRTFRRWYFYYIIRNGINIAWECIMWGKLRSSFPVVSSLIIFSTYVVHGYKHARVHSPSYEYQLRVLGRSEWIEYVVVWCTYKWNNCVSCVAVEYSAHNTCSFIDHHLFPHTKDCDSTGYVCFLNDKIVIFIILSSSGMKKVC